MLQRIAAIVLIYLCTAATWIALGTTVDNRTQDYDRKLRGAVGELWGAQQKQEAPTICCRSAAGWGERKEGPVASQTTAPDAKQGGDTAKQPSRTDARVALQASDLTVDLNYQPRQKGLLWYSTYRVKFWGRYKITNSTDAPQEITFHFKLPSQRAIYDDVKFRVGGREIPDLPIRNGRLTAELSLAPGQSEWVDVDYSTAGMDEWWYDFGSGVNQVMNFSLTMNTDFDRIDFPENGISPTNKEKTSTGWKLQWVYTNLLSSVKIGMAMPHKLNPGPWVSQVSYAAPISLFLFFFLLFVITLLRDIKIHPVNYFFIGASFFSFHLLLAYLVDHISIHAAFMIASAVSVALVISYMRLVVGKRFAFVEVGISQVVFLVLFSYSFFFKGYTGLTITVLSIATLFIIMQITARLDWDAVFRKEKPGPKADRIHIPEPGTAS